MNQNPGKLIGALTRAQANMQRVQKEVEDAVFEAESGGGLVSVRVNGKGELLSIKIQPELLSEDVETVEDLVLSAQRIAYSNKETFAKEKLKSVTAGLLPVGLKIPGLG